MQDKENKQENIKVKGGIYKNLNISPKTLGLVITGLGLFILIAAILGSIY